MSALETWRPVCGYEGAYSVSDHGRVRAEDRMLNTVRGIWYQEGRLLRPYRSGPLGHLKVDLYHGRRLRKKRYVYRLMLEAFIGPCPESMEALHEDDDRSNNHLSNLRWGTSKENSADAKRNKKRREAEASG